MYSSDHCGQEVQFLRDEDGDNKAELAIGCPSWKNPGRVEIYSGDSAVGSLTSADAATVVIGETTGDFFGQALAQGDVTGDGKADLVIGAPYNSQAGIAASGAVYVFEAPWL